MLNIHSSMTGCQTTFTNWNITMKIENLIFEENLANLSKICHIKNERRTGNIDRRLFNRCFQHLNINFIWNHLGFKRFVEHKSSEQISPLTKCFLLKMSTCRKEDMKKRCKIAHVSNKLLIFCNGHILCCKRLTDALTIYWLPNLKGWTVYNISVSHDHKWTLSLLDHNLNTMITVYSIVSKIYREQL